MSVNEKQLDHFRHIAQASAELDEARAESEARRDPGEKMTRGLELSDFGIRMGADVRGSRASATGVSDAELLAQGSLSHLWRTRARRTAA